MYNRRRRDPFPSLKRLPLFPLFLLFLLTVLPDIHPPAGKEGDDSQKNKTSILASRLREELPQLPSDLLTALEEIPRKPFVPAPFRRYADTLSSLPGHETHPLTDPVTLSRILLALPREKKELRVFIAGHETAYPALLAARLIEPVNGTVKASESSARAYQTGSAALDELPSQENLDYQRGWKTADIPEEPPEEAPFDVVILLEPLPKIGPFYRKILAGKGRGIFCWKQEGGGTEWIILNQDSSAPLAEGLPTP